jgi:hypothetical protein
MKPVNFLRYRLVAYRLGMPVPPPVSVDVTVSKVDDANVV